MNTALLTVPYRNTNIPDNILDLIKDAHITDSLSCANRQSALQ